MINISIRTPLFLGSVLMLVLSMASTCSDGNSQNNPGVNSQNNQDNKDLEKNQELKHEKSFSEKPGQKDEEVKHNIPVTFETQLNGKWVSDCVSHQDRNPALGALFNTLKAPVTELWHEEDNNPAVAVRTVTFTNGSGTIDVLFYHHKDCGIQWYYHVKNPFLRYSIAFQYSIIEQTFNSGNIILDYDSKLHAQYFEKNRLVSKVNSHWKNDLPTAVFSSMTNKRNNSKALKINFYIVSNEYRPVGPQDRYLSMQ